MSPSRFFPTDEVLDLTGSSQKKVNDWLKAASGAGYPWIAQKLLEHGGQPNTICTGNVTPLMSAVMSGNLEATRPLRTRTHTVHTVHTMCMFFNFFVSQARKLDFGMQA